MPITLPTRLHYLKKLNLLQIVDLYKYQAIVDTHLKIQQGGYKIDHNVNTRNRNLSRSKFHKKARTHQSIATCGPNLWNSLPPEIRSIKSIPRFKRHLKTFFVSKYGVIED